MIEAISLNFLLEILLNDVQVLQIANNDFKIRGLIFEICQVDALIVVYMQEIKFVLKHFILFRCYIEAVRCLDKLVLRFKDVRQRQNAHR